MNSKNQFSGAALAATALALGGCNGDFIANQTEERSGNVTAVFINNTPFRAVFSFGVFDALDRNPPGPLTFQQTQVEAFTESGLSTLPCRRDFAIGTNELLRRALDTNSASQSGFIRDAFVSVVNFSSAPTGTPSAAIATDGTANGFDAKLGVHYTCGDQLIFTFEVDETKTGGFRIDLTVIPDIEPDA